MLKIHFLNVGHGDCTIVEFLDNNRTTLIDINRSQEYDETTKAELEACDYGNSSVLAGAWGFSKGARANSLDRLKPNDPIAYFQQHKLNKPFRFISTHPHMDHLNGLNDLKNEVGYTNFWVVRNNLEPTGELSQQQEADWALYKNYRNSVNGHAEGSRIIGATAGQSEDFWNQDGIQILSPCSELIQLAREKNEPNIMSYVLLITYANRRILLGGDAVKETWEYVFESHGDKIRDILLLKASHHGRDTGYYQPAVKLMNPRYVVVSVGTKPETDASNKYRKFTEYVWSTRWRGNIVFEIESNGKCTYKTEYD
jgi:competence protein ComEC